jgi:hypothetical protein
MEHRFVGDEPFRQGRAPAQLDGRRGRVFSLRLSAEDEKTITDNLRKAQAWQESLPWDKRPAGWSWRPISLGAFMVWAASTWSAPAPAGKTKRLERGKTKRRARRPRPARRARR